MEWIGWICALFVGISLGLIGGGGSILAVPILAYLFGLDETESTAYSLFVVGMVAVWGGVAQNRKSNVDWRTALVFGLPAMVGVWLVRHFLIPAMPEELFSLFGTIITRRMVMFGLFAILMLVAGGSMLSKKKKTGGTGEVQYNYAKIIVEGLLVGALTGMVGAGGGFLIIPALVFFANLEMKKAIGTSLVIVAIKSLVGFSLGDALTMTIDWMFLIGFTGVALLGMVVGTMIGAKVDGAQLKRGFAYFVLIMAVFVFIMEFWVK